MFTKMSYFWLVWKVCGKMMAYFKSVFVHRNFPAKQEIFGTELFSYHIYHIISYQTLFQYHTSKQKHKTQHDIEDIIKRPKKA